MCNLNMQEIGLLCKGLMSKMNILYILVDTAIKDNVHLVY
jgi:hypothetical protein